MVMAAGSPDLLIFATLDDLLRDLLVLDGPDGMGSISEYGFLVSRAFLELDALGDNGFENKTAENLTDPFDDVSRDVSALVVKGDQDAEDLEVGVSHLFDFVNRLQKVVGSLEAKIGRLDRNQNMGGGDERVERDQP
jgi:hypothetical protein